MRKLVGLILGGVAMFNFSYHEFSQIVKAKRV